MAPGMMPQISANIQNATFFTIMAGETADVSNKDQLVIYIRWVDDRFVVYEVFVGMHPLEKNKQSKTKQNCYSSCQQQMLLVNDRFQL